MNARVRPIGLLIVVAALAACGDDARETRREAGQKPAAEVASPNAQLGDAAPVAAGPGIDALRREIPLEDEAEPLPIARVDNRDLRRERAYPMQPPTIPHAIDGYQVDRNVNRCMDCHSRQRADEFQAVPVSVTHYMDRDGNFLATISPRRYFCTACHVVQHDARLLVENRFEDVDSLLRRSGGVVEGTPPAAAPDDEAGH